MGHSYRNDGAITDFWPDDTNDTIYLTDKHTLGELIDIAIAKFKPNFRIDRVEITSEFIHTSCLTYDSTDLNDYTCFTVIRLTK